MDIYEAISTHRDGGRGQDDITLQTTTLDWQLVLSLKEHRPVGTSASGGHQGSDSATLAEQIARCQTPRVTLCLFTDLISCNRRGIEMIHKEEPTQVEFLLLEWSLATEDGSTRWRWHVQWYSWTSVHIQTWIGTETIAVFEQMPVQRWVFDHWGDWVEACGQ